MAHTNQKEIRADKSDEFYPQNRRNRCKSLLFACCVPVLFVSCSIPSGSEPYFCEVTDVRKEEINTALTGERARDLKKALDKAYKESPACVQPEGRAHQLIDNQGRFRSISHEGLILSMAFTEGAESSCYEITRTSDNQFIMYGKELQHPHELSEDWVERLRGFIWKNREAL